MIKKAITFALLIFLLSNISASCNDTQININSASLEELQGITQIGPSRAQQIISLRPFNSVDDLARVSGIGNGTRLNQIKTENLACVVEETSNIINDEENPTPELNQTIIQDNQNIIQEDTLTVQETESYYFPENASLPKITLNMNAQNIKSNNEKKDNNNYSIYGLILICILLIILLAIKKFRKNKNEFRE